MPDPIELAEQILDFYLRAGATERRRIEAGLAELWQRHVALFTDDGPCCGCSRGSDANQCPDPDIAREWGPCGCDECHASASPLVARCDDAIAHGARALDLLAARQPAPGRCPGCGCTIGSGDVICDRCHEQHPGHRPSTDTP